MAMLLQPRLSPIWTRTLCRLSRTCPCICHKQSVNNVQHRKAVHSNPWKDADTGGKVEIPLGERSLNISTGRLAKFADGCAVAQCGDTSVMVTAVGRSTTKSMNFLPLTVDYRQKAAAAGRIPTNYLRRELGPTDKEILTSRMIDRSIRPLFPAEYSAETQLVCNLLAVDGSNDPDIVSINAASAALALSDIPWNGPVGAVRVGYVDSELVINPTRKQLQSSLLNLVITGTSFSRVVMLEASAENVARSVFSAALREGVKHTESIIENIGELGKKHGKTKRALAPPATLSQEIVETMENISAPRLREIFTDYSHHKISRDEAIFAVREDAVNVILGSNPDTDYGLISQAFNAVSRSIFRELIFQKNSRCDGRELNELRPISCEVDLYEPLHGSALFQRGQTQVLCTATFDSPDSAAKLDTMSAITGGIKEKNFFLHYEFPPYATNETGRTTMGRRELGHGALAEKALRPVVPNNMPFTVRLTAEVLESNGSSSMASACAGSLALMDAGVPISEPVAGVAVGLVTRPNIDGGYGNDQLDYQILTDLLGIEDYMGDMDFKMAGTRKGITALQADIKLAGLPLNIILEATQVATDGIHKIIDIMDQTLPQPRESRKKNSPISEELKIPIQQRAKFMGLGGYNIRKIMAETGVSISSVDETTFQMFAPNETAMQEAKETIETILSEQREPVLEFGAIYQATIVEIREYGVMVQLYTSMTPTLIHLSQLDQRKVKHPSALGMEVGQQISVKYFGRDPATGNVRLSRKVLVSSMNSILKSVHEKK